ncbi:MAG: ABC-F family ATP-binding cassette domain-containing protein [Tissierellales bacterium]|nr:ABC-F family ATP-binding cassette domain-containing protein [Tissierellales bacterium]
MIELAVKGLEKSFGATKIFENISFDIKTKERVALIGRNGTGKTTLMKILMGKLSYDSGQISIKKGASLGYLDQIPEYPKATIAIDVMREAFKNLDELERKLKELEVEMSTGNVDEKILKRYGDLQNQFENVGGYNIKEKVGKISEGLKISEEMRAKEFEVLSGGEKSRIILGKILLENPDILLLDEPSNHLDLASIEWLENFLSDYDGTVLMISHDRYFLERFATKIIELKFDCASEYKGNYQYYLEERDRRFEEAMKFYNAQQRKIKSMEEQIKRYRIWGEMRDSNKMYRKAKELEKRLDKIERVDKPRNEEAKIKIKFGGFRSGQEVLNIKNLKKSFEGQLLFDDLNLNVFYKDQVGIMGDNGTGKSTLLKIIMGEMESDRGEIKLGSRVKIGYLPQEVSFENEEQTLVECFNSSFGISISEARRVLSRALFTEDDVFKSIKYLSGGEKSRLKLAMLMEDQVNVLILDEPTNHLDLDSREMLEDSLMKFDGSLIFVSHDRYFLNKMATKLGELENKKLKYYIGDYEYYKSEKLKVNEVDVVGKSNREFLSNNKDKKMDYEEQKNYERELRRKNRKIKNIEDEIDIREEQKKQLEKEMISHSTDASKLHELQIEIDKCDEEILKYMDEWEILQK